MIIKYLQHFISKDSDQKESKVNQQQ